MDKKIKVLHYGLSSNRGGIENVVLSWLDNKPEDISFDFVFEGDEPLTYQNIIDSHSDANVYRIPNRFKHPIKHYFELKKLVNNYDYFHCHIMTMAEPFVSALISKKNNYKIIFHCHSMYKNLSFSNKEKFLQKISLVLLRHKDYFKLACSKDAGEFMFKNNFTVIENGIDVASYKFSNKKRIEIRKKLNINNNDILIGHVGHSCFEKNYPFLLSSFSSLNDKKYKLLLIGNMDKNDAVKNLVINNGIEDRVIFTGLVADTKDYYSAMDLFYLPSLNEGFPVTLVEAQANGLSCITSKNVTKDVKISNNLLFIDFDNNEFKNSVKKLMDNKVDRNNVDFDMKYDIKNSSKKMFEFYRDNIN